MSDSIESALLIQLAGTLQWSAAVPPLDRFTGTLTAIDPGLPMDITQYARRDREFQHRDMVAAAAVAKVSIFARTVWNGTVVQPVLQGVTEVTDFTGTNVVMPLDPSQVGDVQPNTSTAVQYVLNADVPYAAVQVTDVDLYNRDLMLFETLARAATIFSTDPPINRIDPGGVYIGSTSVWATAQGTNRPKVPNAAEPMSQATLKDPDLYLAERDNQVAAYVSRVVQALQNPFEYATRIYVQITSPFGGDAQESETYVLTENRFVSGNTYTAGEQVLYLGAWYQAIVTTTDIPPSANWTLLGGPTQLQFLGDPSLDSRNRIVYDRNAKTLQWFRETLDLVHIPQIVGFYVPGILAGQIVQTMPSVPERKDAQFYRQKAARVQFNTGTFNTQQVFTPTANRDTGETNVTGGLPTLFGDTKFITLPIPDGMTVAFQDLICTSGTYALDCLVRPSPNMAVAGGDNDQGSVDTSDGGTTYGAIGAVRNWEVALPAGGWRLFIDFANVSATPTTSFGIKATQGATSIFTNTLPLYYTDPDGNPLPQNTVISSPGIDLQSTGQVYSFSVQWTAGSGSFHVTRLRFEQVSGPDTSHYIMQAAWLNSISSVADTFVVAGGDAEGVTPTGDGGVDFTAFNTPITWLVTLDQGQWQMTINYSNSVAEPATQFDIAVTLPGLSNQHFTLPYTTGTNSPLPPDTIQTSQEIGVPADGNEFPISISWLPPGTGRFHIRDLSFELTSSQNSVSKLDVIGQSNMADVMPFRFYLSGTDSSPQIQVSWLPKSASVWQAKAYNPGDQVLLNLVYWQATAITLATDIPGQSSKWTVLGVEPQVPLLFEQIQLSKLVETIPTPDVVGFQGFRQDMLERALRADQDAYTQALKQVGTIFPEFRDTADSWTFRSTGSWMSFMEVYAPRLRQVPNVQSGDIVPGHQYEAITQEGELVVYDGVTYSNGQKFYGLTGITTFSVGGSPIVNQVGAYAISRPGDIGKTGLVPAGIEYVRLAGTGTIHGWYPSYASYPTHQAIQPWMIEQGFYVADDDFESPDGNPVPPPAADNPPVPHPPVAAYIFIPNTSGDFLFPNACAGVSSGGVIYFFAGVTAYSTVDGVTLTPLGDMDATFAVRTLAAGAGLLVGAGSLGGITVSADNGASWTTQVAVNSMSAEGLIYAGGRFVAVGSGGDTMSSTDGLNWTDHPSGGSEEFLGVAYGSGLYVAVGRNGTIYTSPDSVTWTPRTSGIGTDLNAVASDGTTFVAISLSFDLLTSADGITWVSHGSDPTLSSHAITFGNGAWVIGNDSASMWISADGINYTLAENMSSPIVYMFFHPPATFVGLQTFFS